MGKRLIAVIAGALAVGLVMAGCGGGDSSPPPITKAEFITKADAACKKGEKQIETDFGIYIKEHADLKNPTKADFAELVDAVLVSSVEQEIDDIRALGAPKGDEDQIEAMLEAREESLEVAQGDPQAVINDSEKVFGKASKLANEYGLEACGKR